MVKLSPQNGIFDLDLLVWPIDNSTVSRYCIDRIAKLARQMLFTPTDTRSIQVAAAEQLLHSIDPNATYPGDFVVFRITGYRPIAVSDELLAGDALQHDLGALIEQVTDSLDLLVRDLNEPVLQIGDVCQRFSVTSKTIQRWRRKGLPARRFIFPDGKRRVGFLLSSVERFLASRSTDVVGPTNCSRVADDELSLILQNARRLVTRCSCNETDMALRIGRKFNRSPEAVLHLIRKHDVDNLERAILPLAVPAMSEKACMRAVRRHRRGWTLSAIARRAKRSRATIYRVLMQQRTSRLTRRKIRFIDDALYHQPDADNVMEMIATQDDQTATSPSEQMRCPRDLPPYLQSLYRVPLLSAPRERALFLKYNFHKYRFVSLRREVAPTYARARQLHALENQFRLATETKNLIIQANLRLVVSVARKHLRPGLSLMELISEGNIVLMRAVDGFDPHRGFRFSTYATLALMKGFARSVSQMAAKGTTGDSTRLAACPDHRQPIESARLINRDQVSQMLSCLDERERQVLLAHYGLGNRAVPATLQQVGIMLGMSRHRVRELERSAMIKLRALADSGMD